MRFQSHPFITAIVVHDLCMYTEYTMGEYACTMHTNSSSVRIHRPT